jgi:hypothetical protein
LLPDGVGQFEATNLLVGTGSIDDRIERNIGLARVSDLHASGVAATVS